MGASSTRGSTRLCPWSTSIESALAPPHPPRLRRGRALRRARGGPSRPPLANHRLRPHVNLALEAWLISSCVGIALLIATRSARRDDGLNRAAVHRTSLALAAGAMPLLEFLARRVVGAATAPHLTRWPFMVASVLGIVPISMSLLDARFGTLPRAFEVTRVVHLLAWAFGILVAVSMVLDV